MQNEGGHSSKKKQINKKLKKKPERKEAPVREIRWDRIWELVTAECPDSSRLLLSTFGERARAHIYRTWHLRSCLRLPRNLRRTRVHLCVSCTHICYTRDCIFFCWDCHWTGSPRTKNTHLSGRKTKHDLRAKREGLGCGSSRREVLHHTEHRNDLWLRERVLLICLALSLSTFLFLLAPLSSSLSPVYGGRWLFPGEFPPVVYPDRDTSIRVGVHVFAVSIILLLISPINPYTSIWFFRVFVTSVNGELFFFAAIVLRLDAFCASISYTGFLGVRWDEETVPRSRSRKIFAAKKLWQLITSARLFCLFLWYTERQNRIVKLEAEIGGGNGRRGSSPTSPLNTINVSHNHFSITQFSFIRSSTSSISELYFLFFNKIDFYQFLKMSTGKNYASSAQMHW